MHFPWIFVILGLSAPLIVQGRPNATILVEMKAPEVTTPTTTIASVEVSTAKSQVIVNNGTLSSTSSSLLSTTTEREWEYIGPIRVCPKGTDEELNACFALILQDIRPKLADGIPEINLPPLDPLTLDRTDFQQGSGAIVIKASFTDLKIRGLSNFTEAKFTIDTKAHLMNFKMRVPVVRINGTYTLGGNLFFFPIGGSGPYWFVIGGLEVDGYCVLKVLNQTKKAIGVERIHLNMEIKDIKVQLLNLFNGNQILGPLVNNVINDNAQDLFQDIKPAVSAQIGGIIQGITNAVLQGLPFLADFF